MARARVTRLEREGLLGGVRRSKREVGFVLGVGSQHLLSLVALTLR